MYTDEEEREAVFVACALIAYAVGLLALGATFVALINGGCIGS